MPPPLEKFLPCISSPSRNVTELRKEICKPLHCASFSYRRGKSPLRCLPQRLWELLSNMPSHMASPIRFTPPTPTPGVTATTNAIFAHFRSYISDPTEIFPRRIPQLLKDGFSKLKPLATSFLDKFSQVFKPDHLHNSQTYFDRNLLPPFRAHGVHQSTTFSGRLF